MKCLVNRIVVGATVGTAVLTPLLMVSCSSTQVGASAEPVRAPTKFDADLLGIAAEYRSWERVTRDPGWAPYLCRSPSRQTTWMSASSVSAAHGRKLYDLYARDRIAYGAIGGENTAEVRLDTIGIFRAEHEYIETAWRGVSPLGQAIVKESWQPVECAPTEPSVAVGPGGLRYRRGDKGDLFIMYKLDPETEGTDQGWIYGTVTPDGKTVTSAGRVASCMSCHVNAGKDRLFGLIPFDVLRPPSAGSLPQTTASAPASGPR